MVVVNLQQIGGIEVFKHVIETSADIGTLENSVWAIGNICGDCLAMRNEVLRSGILVALKPRVQSVTDLSDDSCLLFMRNVAWCVSNFCRGKPSVCQSIW